VVDDDLDLDLDLDSEPQPPKKKGLFGRAKSKPASDGKPAPTADKPESKAPPAKEPADEGAAEEASAPKKPGLLDRLRNSVSGSAGRIRVPDWNFRALVIGILVLLMLELARENWPAVRLNLLGLHADVPKCVALIVFFALGFAVGWLVFRRRHPAPTEPTEEG